MFAVSDQDLHSLLTPPPGDGQFLSCYAALDTPDANQGWEREFESRASDLHREIHANDQARADLDLNLLAVRRVLSADVPRHTPWVAVFSCVRRDFLRVVRLDVPVAGDLSFGKTPHLVPMLRALHQRREYLVVQADTHRARIFSATAARIVDLSEMDAEVPKKHHSSGEKFGYDQNIIARHREDHIRHVRKELVEHVERRWGETGYAGLILLGEHVTIEHLRDSLPPRLRGAVVREEKLEWDDRGTEARRAIQRIVRELQVGGLEQAIRDRIFQNSSVALGSGAVLEALDHGRVGASGHGCLVLGPDTGELVGVCAECRTLSVEPLGACPKCQARCAPASLQQELLGAALRRHIAVHFTNEANELRPYGGIVALLAK
ncbi:MAG: hypothetical protein U0791_00860 [Gemmataceae bacterium]